jgi:hypothetical protein
MYRLDTHITRLNADFQPLWSFFASHPGMDFDLPPKVLCPGTEDAVVYDEPKPGAMWGFWVSRNANTGKELARRPQASGESPDVAWPGRYLVQANATPLVGRHAQDQVRRSHGRSQGARVGRRRASSTKILAPDLGQIVVASSAKEIETLLNDGFDAWAKYRDRILGKDHKPTDSQTQRNRILARRLTHSITPTRTSRAAMAVRVGHESLMRLFIDPEELRL